MNNALAAAPSRSITAAITAHAVSKTYGHGAAAVRALDGLTVEFSRGEFAAVMGPSGSGKSTLMHCLAGLDKADGGRIVVDSIDVMRLDEKQRTMLRRDRLGFVFQAFNLIPSLTAAENIMLPLTLAGRPVDRDWFASLVDTLGIDDRLTHRPSELSGGQQQRVACARALVSRPEVIFADEPTGSLDSLNGERVMELLVEAARERVKAAVLLVTHEPRVAAYADREVILRDGRAAMEPVPA